MASMWTWNWSAVCENGLDPFVSSPQGGNSSTSDLGPCFQQICLQFPVFACLAVFSAYYFGSNSRVIERNRIQRRAIFLRLLSVFGLAGVTLGKVFVMIKFGYQVWPADVLVTSTEFFAWIVHFGWLTTLMVSGVLSHRGPLILSVCYSSVLVLVFVWLRSSWTHDLVDFAIAKAVLILIYGATLIPKGSAEIVWRNRNINDERQALLASNYISFDECFDEFGLGAAHDDKFILSRLVFAWVTPLISKGVQGFLNKVDDLFDLPECLSISKIQSAMQSYLQASSSLFRALHRSFGVEFYLIGFLRLTADLLGFAGPLLLGGLLSQGTGPNTYLLALGLFLATLLSALFGTHFNWRISLVTMKMRIGLVSAIYRKTLEGEGIQPTQSEILVLMSTDTDRIVNSCVSFHSFWSIPFQLVATLYLLYTQLGVAFVAGVVFAAALIPLNRWIAVKIASLSEGLMSAKDQRVSLTSEVMGGARQIKLNAWEDVFIRRIADLRQEEVKFLAKRKYLDALCVYFWATTPILMCVLTFGTFVMLGKPLTAATTYTSVALLNMLIGPLNSFPWVLNGLAEAWVSLKRVQKLIDVADLDFSKIYTEMETNDFRDLLIQTVEERPVVLEVKDGSFQYDEARIGEEAGSRGHLLQLKDINLKARKGELICVKGSVGSGKSSLLLSLLGNLKQTKGQILVDDASGGFGYVAQKAWLQRGTIRDNIIWGSFYDEAKYKAVLASCCLQDDLEALGGDCTGVGESGQTLSGGQRARVALARALYQDKNIYLLDDVLSALDAHVASYIIKHCIFGLLATKTRIIVTENRTVLTYANQVVEMMHGKLILRDRGNGEQLFNLASTFEEVEDIETETELASISDALLGDDDGAHSIDSIMMEETKEQGNLSMGVLKFYWDAMTGPVGVAVLAFVILMQVSRNLTDTWLAHWVTSTTVNSTLHASESSRNQYLGVYVGLAGINSLITLARAFIFAFAGIKAARYIHDMLLTRVLRTRFQFFDITPLGRILNRFSSDTYTIDDSLPFILNILLAQLAGLLGALIVSLYALPWLGLVVVPLVPIYLSLQNRYRFASRDIKRLSSNALSPLYAHFTETLAGLQTIRAMKAADRFKRDFSTRLEESIRAQLTASAAQNWLGLRLQLLGSILVGGAGFIAAATAAHMTSPGLVGLAISYALSITSLLGGVLTAFAETEQEFVAVERTGQYCELEEEINADGTMDPPYGWPCQGVLSFDNVQLRYRRNLAPALSNINLNTAPCERIGIVGRTGAGKSSILAAVLRVAPLSRGIISLDCVNLAVLPLRVLRDRISVITQDAFLFGATVRENLDPRDEHVDSEIWSALSQCLASPFIQAMGGLDAKLATTSLSAGQRQLLCLTRALIKNSKVVLVDEGTANLDEETEQTIQTVLRTAFRSSTLLIIAHRLNGLEHMDRIVVVSNGTIVETGSPLVLAKEPNSAFHQLLHEQGNSQFDYTTDLVAV